MREMKKPEIIIVREPEFLLYEPMDFQIAPPASNKAKYSHYSMPVITLGLGEKVDFLGEKTPGFPGRVKLLKRTN